MKRILLAISLAFAASASQPVYAQSCSEQGGSGVYGDSCFEGSNQGFWNCFSCVLSNPIPLPPPPIFNPPPPPPPIFNPPPVFNPPPQQNSCSNQGGSGVYGDVCWDAGNQGYWNCFSCTITNPVPFCPNQGQTCYTNGGVGHISCSFGVSQCVEDYHYCHQGESCYSGGQSGYRECSGQTYGYGYCVTPTLHSKDMATIDITLDEEWEIWVRKSNIEKAILKKGASQPFAAAVIAGAVSLNQSEEQPTIQLLSGTGLTTNDVKVEILERPRPSNNGLLRLKVKDKGAGAHKIRIRVLENYYSF